MSNIKLKNNPELVAAIEAALNAGDSVRGVAKDILGAETRESTIRAAIKRGDITLGTDGDAEDTLSEEQIEVLCEHPDYSVSNLAKRLRSAQRTNTQLRKVQKELFDGADGGFTLEDFTSKLKSELKLPKRSFTKVLRGNPSERTVEVLFSDLQIGKCSEFYNTENALSAMEYYGQEVLNIIKEVNPEKIVFASLGDIIECAKKHGLQSAYSTDTSNAQQLANATKSMWKYVVEPLISTGISMTILGVAGNHGSDAEKGFNTLYAA